MSDATWLDPAITPIATLNALDFMAGDGNEESAALGALIAARAVIQGDVAIYMQTPPVGYAVASGAIDSATAVVASIPGGTLIYGDGPASVVRWMGVVKEGDPSASLHTGSQQLFRAGGARVLIRDLAIVGENDPFTAYANNQSAAIKTVATDCMIRDVSFANLIGFSAIDNFNGPGRNHLLRCMLTDCANGTNFGSDYSVQYRNRYVNTEGTEYAGAPGMLALNDFTNGSVSAGGNTSAGARKAGTLVVGMSAHGGVGDVAIITAEAFVDGWVQGAVVDGTQKTALQVGSSRTANYDSNTVVDSVLDSVGVGSSGSIALEVVAGASDTLIASCSIVGHNKGAEVRGDRARLFDNTAFSQFAGDAITFAATAQDATAIDNNQAPTFLSGATQLADAVRPTGMVQKIFGSVAQGFATVQVQNWDDAASVMLDFSGSGLVWGDAWELRHPYDLLGSPYASGVYVGLPVPVPMRAVAPPDDWAVSTAAPLPTLGPRFNAFLLRKTGTVTRAMPIRRSA